MDGIFKKTTNVFNVVPISVKEPYRYDKHGQLKDEFLAEAGRRPSSVKDIGWDGHDVAESRNEVKDSASEVS
jgi:hypothetical protein